MAFTQAQVEQAKKLAKQYGYTVSPEILKQSSNSKSMQEKIDQLELENRMLKASQNKPGRTSLVESRSPSVHTSNGYSNRRNALNERLEKYDLAMLADRTQGLPEGFPIEQALKDFSLLYGYKTGLYQED